MLIDCVCAFFDMGFHSFPHPFTLVDAQLSGLSLALAAFAVCWGLGAAKGDFVFGVGAAFGSGNAGVAEGGWL